MSKNGAGYDPDIEDVPGNFGEEEVEEVETEDDVHRMMRGDEFEDEEGGFVPEEDLIG